MSKSKSNRLTAKLIETHVPGCYAVRAVGRGDWNSAWFINGETVYRDRLGRKMKSSIGLRWFVLQCNCTDCKARMIVSENALLSVAPKF